MYKNTHFTLTSAEAAVAAACTALFRDTNNPDAQFYWDARAKALYEKLCKVHITRGVRLDIDEVILLKLAVNLSSSFLYDGIQYYRERDQNNPKHVVMLTQFENFKKGVPRLLWKLILPNCCCETSLDTLENIYGFETGVVRKLKLNRDRQVLNILVKDLDVAALQLLFESIDMLKGIQDQSEFAKKVFLNQYFHVSDYVIIRHQYYPLLQIDNSIEMTQYSGIMFYWIGAVVQRMFLSDAAGYFEKTICQGSADQFQQTRDLQFLYITNMQNKIRESLRQDTETLPYLEMVNYWDNGIMY